MSLFDDLIAKSQLTESALNQAADGFKTAHERIDEAMSHTDDMMGSGGGDTVVRLARNLLYLMEQTAKLGMITESLVQDLEDYRKRLDG